MSSNSEEWQVLFSKLDDFISQLKVDKRDPRRKGHLIRVLHQAQNLFGYLPQEVMQHVADALNLHFSEVSGVVSFYNYFTTTPKGKFSINVCTGTACYVKGADKVLSAFEQKLGIKDGGVTEDGLFSITTLRCVGACGLAPVAMVNGKVYGRMTTGEVTALVDSCKKSLSEEE